MVWLCQIKYGKNAKLWFMDTGSFIVHDIYKDIAADVETSFDTSNFEIGGPLQEKIKKWLD